MADTAKPHRSNLTPGDVTILIVGIILGIGIFKTPSLVAGFSTSEIMFIAFWVAGGVITLAGAICYAELSSARPDSGGEYSFLRDAYGQRTAFLFAWARCSVIQPGAIAAVAFVLGDYANGLVSLGPYGAAIYGIFSIALFTAINGIGTLPGKHTQKILEALTIVAIIVFIVAAFSVYAPADRPAAAPIEPSWGGAGLAMVFVLLTYGGWSEAAYLSGELKDARRKIAPSIIWGVLIVVALYVVANLAYLRVLGLEGIRGSETVGADLMRVLAGDAGAWLFSLVVIVAALTTLSGTIFTGARSYYAVGRDLTVLRYLGVWKERGETPANALYLQGGLAVLLVVFGAASRGGFEAMVAYTAPVFWLFILLVGLSVFIFRRRESALSIGQYRMPLYPLPPLLLVLSCGWMLYSSVIYAGWGSIIGMAVLACGVPVILLRRPAQEPRLLTVASPSRQV
jgi:basic amino acid/polyamine antiporter, APA family